MPVNVPARRGGTGRRVLLLLFWVGLVLAVLPWWLTTPAGSLVDTGAVMLAAGRIVGLVAGYTMLVQVVLMSRLRLLDRLAGEELMTRWHRDIGGALIVAVLGHMALILVGYGALDGFNPLVEAKVLISGTPDMLTAFLSAGILTAVGLFSIRAVRNAMSYELWRWLHMSTYLVLYLAFGHQFSLGQQLFRPGIVRTGWLAAYVGVVVVLAYGRVIAPLIFNLRYALRVADVIAESPDTVSIYLTGRKLDRLKVLGGQWFRFRFLSHGLWWQSHPFSVSAAKNGRWLRLTIKVVGAYTRELRELDAGSRVWAIGPRGNFTAAQRTAARSLLIAGGIGITPIRAMLEELPPGATLIYRASTPAEVVLQREIDWLARARDVDVWYVIGARTDPGPRQVMSPNGLRQLVPDLARRDVYLCGPPGFVEAAQKTVRKAGVPRSKIHLAAFEL
ncbi:putative ferric reductase [Asanoa ferruginea]|uniref:Putative ferric reductase n=1 Tax=Asanoa ferruginea TaxID=53367 RepID=A0A3E0A1E0_9ACTN|nr:ferric reductase-like transmembrane domain-containing protein [Asanoa ferruginea]REG02314.1 putative ferric reductase [Asanoa ferruginea]GIF46550.1 ferric reductase [Asanoa ferruginea]